MEQGIGLISGVGQDGKIALEECVRTAFHVELMFDSHLSVELSIGFIEDLEVTAGVDISEEDCIDGAAADAVTDLNNSVSTGQRSAEGAVSHDIHFAHG